MPLSHRAPIAARTAGGLALVALALHAAHTGLGLGRPSFDVLVDEWLYYALMLGAAGAVLVRAATRHEDRAPWLLLGAGALAWALGDLVYTLALADDPDPPLPSVSDALYLAFYPAVLGAALLLVHRHVRAARGSVWIDAVLGALGAGAVGVAVLSDAMHVGVGGTALEVATTLAYPVGDVLLVALVVAVLALTGWRPGGTWGLLGLAVAAGAVGDGIFLRQAAHGTYAEGTLLDSVWPASLLLIAVAAWRQPALPQPRAAGLRQLVIPALFAAAAVTLFLTDQVTELNPLAIALACATIVALVVRMGVTLRINERMVAASRGEALTDALTGMGNRRKLVADLERHLADGFHAEPRVLILFDLDGFKRYNDEFGHLAGDALLTRLGGKLRRAVDPWGEAYRLGGDEFCALLDVPPHRVEEVLAIASGALCEGGEGFDVESSYGAVAIPAEAATPSMALQTADQRMYARKEGRTSPVRMQTRDVLVRALNARRPGRPAVAAEVAQLAADVARRLGVDPEGVDEIARAAELHDVGKVALPDAILEKADELTDEEWAFVRRHTILGERILNGAAAMRPVARLVRSSHERFDGTGYPDGLHGEEIPLGSRIVAVWDAYAAMTSERPYRRALDPLDAEAELRASAGTQFDPAVVEAFIAELRDRTERTPDARRLDERTAYAREVAGRLRSVLAAGALTAGLFVALAAPGFAAAPGTVSVTRGTLEVATAAGSPNGIAVVDAGFAWQVSDDRAAAPAAGRACAAIVRGVRCAKGAAKRIVVDTQDGDDTIAVTAPLPADIRAGDGDDRIDARNGLADVVDCGAGEDRALVDPLDRTIGCETGAPAVAATAPVPAPAVDIGVDPVITVGADGTAPMTLACAEACSGTVYLDPVNPGNGKGRPRPGRFGTATFDLGPGGTVDLNVSLTAEARAQLGLPRPGIARAARRGRSVKAIVTVAPKGKAKQHTAVTLRR